MANIIFSGTLTSVAPISIVLPDAGPAIMSVAGPDGALAETGYVPASTIRGTLRRAVTLTLMREAADAGHPWPMKVIYDRLLGQNPESEDEVEVIDLEAIDAARRSSPILDLFGSGLGLRSTLEVSHAVPVVPTPLQTFKNVRKDLDADPETMGLLAAEDLEVWKDRAAASNRRAKFQQQIEQLRRSARRVADVEKQALDEKLAELEEAVQAERGRMADMEVSTKAIFEYSALPSGVACTHSLRLLNASNDKVALLFAALNYLSLNPVLGGQRARGCGEIRAEYALKRVDGMTTEALGTLSLGGFEPTRFEAENKDAGRWYDGALGRWSAMLEAERTQSAS